MSIGIPNEDVGYQVPTAEMLDFANNISRGSRDFILGSGIEVSVYTNPTRADLAEIRYPSIKGQTESRDMGAMQSGPRSIYLRELPALLVHLDQCEITDLELLQRELERYIDSHDSTTAARQDLIHRIIEPLMETLSANIGQSINMSDYVRAVSHPLHGVQNAWLRLNQDSTLTVRVHDIEINGVKNDPQIVYTLLTQLHGIISSANQLVQRQHGFEPNEPDPLEGDSREAARNYLEEQLRILLSQEDHA